MNTDRLSRLYAASEVTAAEKRAFERADATLEKLLGWQGLSGLHPTLLREMTDADLAKLREAAAVHLRADRKARATRLYLAAVYGIEGHGYARYTGRDQHETRAALAKIDAEVDARVAKYEEGLRALRAARRK